MASILGAIEGSAIEKIVAESTQGARPATRSRDLGILYEMEQALQAQPIPAAIIGAACHMSNWDAALDAAMLQGKLHSLFPADFELPMVAPHDIGQFAARLMRELERAQAPLRGDTALQQYVLELVRRHKDRA